MLLAAIFNTILCIGVIAMVVTPLVWAIRTQQRDWPVTPMGTTRAQPQRSSGRRAPRPRTKAVIGRA